MAESLITITNNNQLVDEEKNGLDVEEKSDDNIKFIITYSDKVPDIRYTEDPKEVSDTVKLLIANPKEIIVSKLILNQADFYKVMFEQDKEATEYVNNHFNEQQFNLMYEFLTFLKDNPKYEVPETPFKSSNLEEGFGDDFSDFIVAYDKKLHETVSGRFIIWQMFAVANLIACDKMLKTLGAIAASHMKGMSSEQMDEYMGHHPGLKHTEDMNQEELTEWKTKQNPETMSKEDLEEWEKTGMIKTKARAERNNNPNA